MVADSAFRAQNPALLSDTAIACLDRLEAAGNWTPSGTILPTRDDIIGSALVGLDRWVTMVVPPDVDHFADLAATERDAAATNRVEIALPALAWIALGRLEILTGLSRGATLSLAIERQAGRYDADPERRRDR